MCTVCDVPVSKGVLPEDPVTHVKEHTCINAGHFLPPQCKGDEQNTRLRAKFVHHPCYIVVCLSMYPTYRTYCVYHMLPSESPSDMTQAKFLRVAAHGEGRSHFS